MTVVVIMFELTGALTYILPTMVKNHRLVDYRKADPIVRSSFWSRRLSETSWAQTASPMR